MPAVSKYHAQNVQALKTLDGNVKAIFYEFLVRIAVAGIYVRVTAARRTSQEQDALYAQGRWQLGSIVTNANDSNSLHVHGLAIDVAPLRKIGPFYTTWYNNALYDQLARVASDLGLEWGFALWHFDRPHFQFSGGLSIADLKAGKRPLPPPFTPIYSSLPAASQGFFAALRVQLVAQGVLPI